MHVKGKKIAIAQSDLKKRWRMSAVSALYDLIFSHLMIKTCRRSPSCGQTWENSVNVATLF